MLASEVFVLLFLSCGRIAADFQVGLEPGHAKQDYDSVEEVRGHEKETKTEKPAEDEHLTKEAILDVAYYLRRFKFSGHDPRYLAKGEIPKQNLFVEFPSPPLRNIHWEVKKNCEPSFVDCVKYLQEQVSRASLPRHLDSVTITRQNGWSFITDRDLIKAADDECLKLLQKDEKSFLGFSGPLQRFQWLTSASYYMCFYTMRETALLRNFTEDCDDFGGCIRWDFGLNNGDVRADNASPFSCAFYSFCPDPCCSLKHWSRGSPCSEGSPCLPQFTAGDTCTVLRKDNSNLESLVLNRWNVSCKCKQPGTRWESKSGMCIDVDECIGPKPLCDFPSETCINLPGTFACTCSPLGFYRDPKSAACLPDPVLHPLLYPARTPSSNYTKPSLFSGTIHQLFLKLKSLFVSSPAYSEPKPERIVLTPSSDS